MRTRWHRLHAVGVAAPPERLFELLSDMPNYGKWLPPSKQFSSTRRIQPPGMLLMDSLPCHS